MSANTEHRRWLAFSIDFEGYVEAMEESFPIAAEEPRFEIDAELEANAEACLQLLYHHQVRATFFILGWIAERLPGLVRRIHQAGHEIASHSFHHRRLLRLGKEPATQQIERSKKALEDAIGEPVIGFRAPDFSLRQDSWLLDHMAKIGFRYDASLNPTTLHDVYAGTTDQRAVYRLGNGLLEFPATTARLPGGHRLVVGGGGYLRLFPWWLTQRCLQASADPMSYLHPYEIGGVFPRHLPMSLLRRLRHNYSSGRLDGKLRRLFSTFRATTMRDYLRRHHDLD